MAKFTLTIDCDNAAFGNPGLELARILKVVGRVLEATIHDRCDSDESPVKDANGNRVGEWSYDGEV